MRVGRRPQSGCGARPVHARAGMDARAISYATAFQFLAMGVAPFGAGLIAPSFGMRAYFGAAIVLVTAGLALWLRRAPAR